MRRIIFLCPEDNAPTGGIKVIYRHAEVLSSLGADAFLLHPFNPGFRCTWFEADVRYLDSLSLSAEMDFVIIPEIWAGDFGPQCKSMGVRYGIFVQNGYMSMPIKQDSVWAATAAYTQADLVLVISDDTAEITKLNYPLLDPSRIVRVQYSVHPRFLSIGAAGAASKSRTITYMPRKLPDHSSRVFFALQQHLPPDWKLVSIHDVDEQTCAAMLGASRIFLAFSHFEGLPLPPLEAAIAGNFVIGYTGQGAREYWIKPNFQEIHQGNIIGFVNAARQAALDMETGTLPLPSLLDGAAFLAERFSPAAEAASLKHLLSRLTACFG